MLYVLMLLRYKLNFKEVKGECAIYGSGWVGGIHDEENGATDGGSSIQVSKNCP